MSRFPAAILLFMLMTGEPPLYAQNRQFETFKTHKFDLEREGSQPLQPGMPHMIYKMDLSAARGKERIILGYLPYWEFSKATLHFEYLTILAYFSAEVMSDGDFSNLHHIGTDELASVINAAHANDCLAIFTITNFNDDSTHALLSSDANRTNAIKNITDLVVNEGADGVNIDFESVGYEDRENFLTFIKGLKKSLDGALGKSHLSMATPAVDYQGSYDYSELAANSDGLMIMAYGYHWKNSDPGPISPLTSGEIWGKYNVTWTVNDYLEWGGVENRHKFILGVPFYGYDYPTTDDKIPGKATASATTVRYRKAEFDGALFGWKWDDNSQTPYYLYNTTQWHQVFCDNAESLGLKFSLVNEKDLGGIGIWALGYEGEGMALWNELADKFGTIIHHPGSDEVEEKDGILKEIKIKPSIYPGRDYPQNFKSHYNLSGGDIEGGGCMFSLDAKDDRYCLYLLVFFCVTALLKGSRGFSRR